MNSAKTKNLLLASQSPRRKEFLQTLSINFEIANFCYKNEPTNLEVPVKHKELIPYYIALIKMDQYLDSVKEFKHNFILTADTLVDTGSNIFGKPATRKDAIKMLNQHLGQSHFVYSAIVLVDLRHKKLYKCIDTAVVTFKQRTKQIDKIIKKYGQLSPPFGPLDKAGGYGIQEPLIRDNLILSIEGDINTIIGFPLKKFKKLWKKINSI